MKHDASIEGQPHSISPPRNLRDPLLVMPIPATFSSPIDFPATSRKKPGPQYSVSSEDVEPNHRGSAPSMSVSDESEPHSQPTPRHSRSHQPHNSDRTLLRNNPSISQSLTSSAVATVTASSNGSIDSSHLRQPFALGELEQKKLASEFDPLRPLATLPRNEQLPTPNVPPSSTGLRSTSRRLQPPPERFPLPDDDDLPPAYDTFGK